MTRHLLPIVLAATLAAPAAAQQEEDRDRGFIVGLIEDNISAPGLSVRLDGFEGALSSEATLERLAVSDDAGTWLVLEDVVLDWNRSALLRGRLEVEALSAGLIRIERAPLPAEGVEALPEAGASGFSLPDLPVSVAIERIAAARIELGEALLGRDVALTLDGAARLADGSGAADFSATRLDGPEGRFEVGVSFDAATEALAIDLVVSEAQGGLAASALGLPGEPAIDLAVAGAGPLDDFTAEIALASDGQDRLAGTVALDGTADGRAFAVDLGGDVTPLFAPTYRDFFGPDVSLVARGETGADGTVLDDLTLRTQALTLEGAARIGSDGWPTFLDLDGRVASADGGPVTLPTADAATLAAADLSLAYDAAVSEDVTLDLTLTDLDGDTRLASATIAARGEIARDGGTVTGATATLRAALDGLRLADDTLSDAIGPDVALSTDIAWSPGAPLALADLALEGAGYALAGDVTIDTTDGVTIGPDLRVTADDLSRFAALAGQDLSGAAEATVSGTLAPLAGTFDVALDAVTTDFAVGIEQADPLLAGRTTLATQARRTVEGTFVDALELSNDALSLTAQAVLPAEDADVEGALRLDARLADASPIDARLDGPVTLRADLSQAGDVWSGTVFGRAPQGVEIDAEGTLTGPAADFTFRAEIPDLSAFVPDIPGGAALDGRITSQGEVYAINTTVDGPDGLRAQVAGTLTGAAPAFEVTADIPRIESLVPEGTLPPELEGRVTLAGTAARPGEAWQVDLDLTAPTGIAARVDGAVTGPSPSFDVSATVPRIEAVVPADLPEGLQGTVTLDGTVSRPAEAWQVDLDATAPSGIAASVRGAVTGEAPSIDVSATVPRIEAVVPAELPEGLQGAVTLDGTVSRPAEAWQVDLTANAPSDIAARVLGTVTGDDAKVGLAVTIPQIADLVPALSGTVSLDTVAARIPEGWRVTADGRGPAGLRASVATRLDGTPLAVDFTAVAPDLSALVEGVPGALDVAGQARQTDTGWNVDVSGTGPYDARFDATAALDDGTPSVAVTARIPETSDIAPQLRGPLDLRAEATQVDGAWRVDAEASGAQSLQASVQGVATGPEADLDISLSAASVAPFASGLSGPLDADARLFQRGGQWALDVDASGPLGATLEAQGTLTGSDPTFNFDLAVPNVGALLPDISGPLRVTGTAGQRGDGFAIDVDARGPAGTQADVAGTIGPGGALNLDVSGSAPLGLANAALAPRRLSGVARFDLAVNGPPAPESVSGTITTSDAALSLPTLGNGLTGIDATVRLAGGRAQIDLRTGLESGGTITVAGPVSLAAPFTAGLAIGVNAQLEDPQLYSARVRGGLRIDGPLTGGAAITGALRVDGAEIKVPSTGLTALGEIPDIRHVNTPAPVRRTLDRAGRLDDAADGDAGGGGGPAYRLDVTIDAERLFVRGRGLDAELGGRLRVTGTTAAPNTAGSIDLVRGRLDILANRFDLDEGAITFQGGLIPFIRLVAITETDTLTASIVVEGPADDIDVRFESTPEVPEEEILAQIFFGRDLSQLSPLQALQLANSVAVLSGRGSAGVLSNLRGNAGLDDLDLTTDEDGNVGVRAGKYISDNVYTDVTIDQEGEAEISLNIDLTDDITVRGATGAEGSTSLGIFFERDY